MTSSQKQQNLWPLTSEKQTIAGKNLAEDAKSDKSCQDTLSWEHIDAHLADLGGVWEQATVRESDWPKDATDNVAHGNYKET